MDRKRETVYKLLLCWRYLLTRYLALACIISVMLGVATLIVVNSVMGGFSSKLRERLHGLLSDVVIEAASLEGFANPDWHIKKILEDPILYDKIDVITPTMEVFAMIQFQLHNGETMTRAVRLVGIDPVSRAQLGGFTEHLKNQKNAAVPSFEPSEDAIKWYLMRNPLALGAAPPAAGVPFPGLPAPPTEPPAARPAANFELLPLPQKAHLGLPVETPPAPPKAVPPVDPQAATIDFSQLPDTPPGIAPGPVVPAPAPDGKVPSPAPWVTAPKIPHGVIVGNLLASIRIKNKETGKTDEFYLLNPGDEVTITTVRGGKLAPAYDHFLVVDYFKSEMSEYDSNYVFVPLAYLQELRGMPDRVTSLQIRLKDYDKDGNLVVERLKQIFPTSFYLIDTWEGRQGPLLAAIQIERGILNVLLFLIIAVAGFGILAIFSMIVTEKTRDIGILKALGASNRGVMAIFLSYGLLLGLVGSGLGTVLGVTLTEHINDVEQWLSQVTGTTVFDRGVYYFDRIPTDIQFWNVVYLNLGAVAIAVFFSVLPALRAAWLHPVRALRYE
jgi:lipoprotein-releasing system permease protein